VPETDDEKRNIGIRARDVVKRYLSLTKTLEKDMVAQQDSNLRLPPCELQNLRIFKTLDEQNKALNSG